MALLGNVNQPLKEGLPGMVDMANKIKLASQGKNGQHGNRACVGYTTELSDYVPEVFWVNVHLLSFGVCFDAYDIGDNSWDSDFMGVNLKPRSMQIQTITLMLS